MNKHTCDNCETQHDSIDEANECCACEICAEFLQLADEMDESECGPFPDSPSSEGWCRAREFYAREIRAILRQSKMRKAPKNEASQ
jgi:hypothetical protein